MRSYYKKIRNILILISFLLISSITQASNIAHVGFSRSVYGNFNCSNGAYFANTIAVINGTVVTGGVSNTITVNEVYLQVQESSTFIINSVFDGLPTNPAQIRIIGRYEGNPAHEVEAQAFNYDSSDWIDMNATTNDFPSSATDSSFIFQFPDLSGDYLSGGQAQVRLFHTSSANVNHDFYLDFIELLVASVSFTTAGEYVALTGFSNGIAKEVTQDSPNGAFVADETGDYLIIYSASFGGTANQSIEIRPFVGGVQQTTIGLQRRLNGDGDVGNASMIGILSLDKDDSINIRATSDVSGTFLSIICSGFTVKKLN